VKNRHSNEIR